MGTAELRVEVERLAAWSGANRVVAMRADAVLKLLDEIDMLRAANLALAERLADCSEALGRAAERRPDVLPAGWATEADYCPHTGDRP